MSRNWKTSQEMIVAWIGGSSGESKKQSDWVHLKGKSGFADGLMSCVKERGNEDDHSIRQMKHEVAVYLGGEERKEGLKSSIWTCLDR